MENTVFNQPSNSENLLLVEALRDSIAQDSSALELPDSHKEEIRSRISTLEEDAKTAVSWETFMKQFL